MIWLDGQAIRLARLDLGLSQRSLAKAVGLTTKSMSDIESGHPGAGQETLLPLQRLVDALGVPLSSLMAEDTPSGPHDAGARAPDAGPDDMAALGSLLLDCRVNTAKSDLADALGWTLDRLRLAAAALDHHLRPLGMQVHSLRGGYRIRPAGGHTDRVKLTADRVTAARTGLTNADAELLHRALAGVLDTKKVAAGWRPRRGRFLRDRVLVDDGHAAVPGPPLLDALDVPE